MNQTEATQTEDALVAEDVKGEPSVPPAASGTIHNPFEHLPLKWDPPQEEEF